LSGD
jgi:hypothetical protein